MFFQNFSEAEKATKVLNATFWKVTHNDMRDKTTHFRESVYADFIITVPASLAECITYDPPGVSSTGVVNNVGQNRTVNS